MNEYKVDDIVFIHKNTSGTDVYDNFELDENSIALHVDASSLCKGGLTNSGKLVELQYPDDGVADD